MQLPFIVNVRRQPVFPSGLTPDEHGLVALGGRLTPEIILEAYTKGIFPWTGEHPIPWFSPDPRLILRPGELAVHRSLRQTLRRGHLRVRFDASFPAMMSLCATTPRPEQDGTWILPNMIRAWVDLHQMGFAHSVEVYEGEALVGGLYGMAIGGAFFGESMCAQVRDASKVALVALCARLVELDFDFIDCQQETDHLKRMGAVAVPRADYLKRVHDATHAPARWSPPLPPHL